jgi:hypothetical protein
MSMRKEKPQEKPKWIKSLPFGIKRGALNRSKTRTQAKRPTTSTTNPSQNPHPLWLKPNSSKRRAQKREQEDR